MISRACLFVSLLGLSAFTAQGGGCKNDVDCQLNGVCLDGYCVCDAPWSGSDCGMLDIMPSPNHVSYHGENERSTSWGGSVLTVPASLLGENESDDEDAVVYVMYVAEMVNECGLRNWSTNSAVAVATASSPAGPYKRHKQIIPTWAHNPQAIQVDLKNAHGEHHRVFVVYTLGDGDGKPVHGAVVDCRGQEEEPIQEPHEFPDMRFPSQVSRRLGRNILQDAANTTVYFNIHYSVDSPLGPFSPLKVAIVDFPTVYGFPGNWNPAPVALADGSVRMMVHVGTNDGKIGIIIVEASSWKGPYRPITGDIISCLECEEDPFMWMDKRGHWHVLYHKMFDPIKSEDYYLYDNYDGHPDQDGCCPSPGWVGGHSFSKDGLVWSEITRCYNTTALFQDGVVANFYRRERPKLLFDPKDGVTPTHISNGVFEKEHGTFTLVQPLRKSP